MSAPWQLSAFLLVALPLAQATDDRSLALYAPELKAPTGSNMLVTFTLPE